MKAPQKIIIAYVPVLHEGYRRFFDKHKDAEALYILGTEVTKEFVPLTKDIRALDPQLIADSLRAWNIFKEIKVIGSAELKELASSKAALVMPDEDVMRELRERYFPNAKVELDSIFLRWDKHKSTEGKPVEADQTISKDAADQQIISLLKKEAEKSADWWRHVAAAVVKDEKVILTAHNRHLPSEQTPYVNGDPRCDFHKGVNLELSSSIHSEAALVAEAAQKGIALEGASMYVTTFPCPPCAKMIAFSGIKKLYYAGGYGVLDGEAIMKSKGVKIIFVDTGEAEK
jgi:dCMP deaminase